MPLSGIFPKRSSESTPAPSSQVPAPRPITTTDKICLAVFGVVFVVAFGVGLYVKRQRKKAMREMKRKLVTAGVDLYVKNRDERAGGAGH
jgi:hypothetical protein